MAKLADAPRLGRDAARHGGSSPPPPTKEQSDDWAKSMCWEHIRGDLETSADYFDYHVVEEKYLQRCTESVRLKSPSAHHIVFYFCRISTILCTASSSLPSALTTR
jgi:hypothetical protein